MMTVPFGPTYRNIDAPAEMDAQSLHFSRDVVSQTAGISAEILAVAGQLSHLSADDGDTSCVL